METTPNLVFSDRFTVGACLGRGSMGVVYRARDRETGTEIALKTLHQWAPEEAYLLKQEFRILADIRHPNLIELHELFAEERSCFFTMELVHGTTLLDALQAARGDWDRIAAMLTQLVRALSAVHARGRLHRDIKPENVLIAADDRVVVLDFGLATMFSGADDGESEFVGTPLYMAPEQMWGMALSPAADWYALGVLLHAAFLDRPPFAGSATEMLAAKGRGVLPGWSDALPDFPPYMDALVVALLHPTPAMRPSGDDIVRTLRAKSAVRAPVQVEARPDGVAPGGGPGVDGPFIGRAFELAALHYAFAESASGIATVLLGGPSGIGKTSLVQQFLGEIQREATVLTFSGRCQPQESLPYQAFDTLVDQLSHHLCQLPPPESTTLLPEHDTALLRIFPVLGRVPGWNVGGPDLPLEPHEIRRRGFVAFRDLLTRLAQHHRLVLWIDDAQWGGTDSAALLRELIRQPEAPPVLLILSYRSIDEASMEMVAACEDADGRGVRAPRAITLAPLSAEETRALAGSLATTAALDVEAIATESEGSPFLLMQLAKFGQSLDTVHVRDVVRHRVRALSADAQTLLALISLAGGPIERGVVLRAAGLGEAGRPLITSLQGERLLRLNQLGSQPMVETYHDRIREGVLGEMQPPDLVERHRVLAHALEDAGAAEPDRLANHFHGARDLERASHYAVLAGDRANTALAFAKAAGFYQQAREWWAPEPGRRTELEVREAQALVNAGHCAEAGARYLAAAQGSPAAAAIDLRRFAAEQFLSGGHVDDGLEVLRPLLADLAIPYPWSAQSAILRAVGKLVRLGVRGTRFHPSDGPPDLVRADVCYSAAKALVIIDPARGVYFSVLGLMLALETGEPSRVCRSLALVGGSVLSVSGGLVGRAGRRLMHQAVLLARAQRDPYLIGMTATSMGPVALVAGDWSKALRNADRGVRLLSQHCRGVSFECAIGRMASMRALEELGRLLELDARAEEMLAAARETGDRYAEVTAMTYAAFTRLAQGESESARALARRALARWSRDSFHIQHMYALRIEVYCDLYEGRPDDARARLAEAWPDLRASSLLRVPLPRVDAHLMRARVHVELARRDPRLLREVERDAKIIGDTGRPEAIAHACLLRAAAAHLRGDDANARALAHQAASAYERARMKLHAMYARRVGIERTDAATLRASDDEVRACGIGNPTRWAAIYAPGLTESTSAASA